MILLNYLISILVMYLKGVKTFIFFGYGASIFFPFLNLLNCKIICNPDGIEWRRPESKIKKIFFKICEKFFSFSNILRVFDSKVIEKYYNIKHEAKGVVIYYPSQFEKMKQTYINKKKKIRFYILGRLLEENNTKMIVEAFQNRNEKLYIIGKSNNYFNKEILPLVKKNKNIIFLGPIYNKEKLFKLCSLCNYYVHGHSVGGTNPTLIEALSLELPVIAFKTYFNKEILGKQNLYFKNKYDLSSILAQKKYTNILKCRFKNEFTAEHINSKYLKLIDL